MVFEMLKTLNERLGMTIVVGGQKIMLLCENAKRLTVMDGGRVILDGAVRSVIQNIDALTGAASTLRGWHPSPTR
jgi:energy-coupling factor transport system ATP-binding protein